MNLRDGQIVLQSARRIVVRGHYTPEEMQRRTGFQGNVVQSHWRHAHTPWKQKMLITTPSGAFIRARKKGHGAFAVTILNIVRRKLW